MSALSEDMDFDPLDPRFLASKDGKEVPPPVGRHVSGARYPTEEDLHFLLNPDPDEPPGVNWRHTGIIVGEPDGSSRRVIHGRNLIIPARQRDAHVMALGPAGTGKTSKVLQNMLASDVADPRRVTIAMGVKGEEYPFVARLLRDTGREVLFIDLDDPHRSLRFNPLATDDPSAAHLAITSFAALMVNPHSRDSLFWKQCGIDFLFAAWECGTRSFPAALELFSDCDAAVRYLRDSKSRAAKSAMSFIEGSSHNAQTALASLIGWLTPFRDPNLAKTTSSHTIDINRILKPGNVTAVYCRESRLASNKPVYNLLLQWLIDSLIHAVADDPSRRHHSPPVSIYVEDLPAWGPIPSLIDRMTTLRSRRIPLTVAIQSSANLRHAYGPSADAVEKSFVNKIIMPGVEQEDAETISKTTGDQVVSIDDGRGNSMLLCRNVLQPADIRSSSWKHFMFGAPATFILRDVAFQAYLCPAYLRPELRAALDAIKGPNDPARGDSESSTSRATTSAGARERLAMKGTTDTQGMQSKQITPLIESARQRCGWARADPTVRRWWQAVETRGADRPARLLHILEELILRELTLCQLYEVYIAKQCGTLGIALLYLDYQTAQRNFEQRREREATRRPSGTGKNRNLFDSLHDELGPDGGDE